MVGAGKVKTEARSYIVKNKNDSLFVAELAYGLPVFGRGNLVVLEIAVVIGLSDKAGNIAVVIVISLLKSVKVKPGNDNIVGNIFGSDSGIVNLLSPLKIAVIIAF